MKKILIILLIIINLILPMSSMAFEYTVDEETGLKLYELPNGVKDEIIDGKLIQRVSNEVILTENMFVNIVNVSDVVDAITIPKSQFNNVLTSVNNVGDRFYITGFSPRNNRSSSDITAVNTVYETAGNFLLWVEKGKYSSIKQVRNELAGISLFYQLETPEVHNLEPIIGHHKVKLLINEFSTHIKNIALAISRTITEFFYNGEAITARGILFFAYVAVVLIITLLGLLFKRR